MLAESCSQPLWQAFPWEGLTLPARGSTSLPASLSQLVYTCKVTVSGTLSILGRNSGLRADLRQRLLPLCSAPRGLVLYTLWKRSPLRLLASSSQTLTSFCELSHLCRVLSFFRSSKKSHYQTVDHQYWNCMSYIIHTLTHRLDFL